ncbi:hypothetical protein DLM45_07535 [Hyphomicrobium methylovorum]|nr:DUF167 family protein [Hyphomicrobium methylovorum]MBA2126073.1 hypothetical protein [Hyphomicrobium methylovorum]
MTGSSSAGGSLRGPWRHGAACVIAHFRVTPRSTKEAIDGLAQTADGQAFQARLRAVPEDGAANRALEALVARWLDVPKRTVTLSTGGKSRLKSVRIDGDPDLLGAKLQSHVEAFSNDRIIEEE